MKQRDLFEGAGHRPASAQFISSYRIALVRDRPLPFGQPTLNNSRDAQALVKTLIETMGQSDREQLVVVLLNSKNEVVGVNLVSTGGISSAPVCPREVVKPAILANAAAIIIGHNHPSGHVEPSAEDHHLTKKIFQAADLIGIHVHEHIIVSMTDDRYFSFADEGIIRRLYDTLRNR